MNGIGDEVFGVRADALVGALGIDVGSLFTKMVWIRPDGVRIADAAEHKGRPVHVLLDLLRRADVPPALPIGVTGPLADVVTDQGVGTAVDPIRAAIRGVQMLDGDIRHILDVGGGSLARISIDDAGQLLEYSSNSLCAAGTGSFLDEQARRLGLDLEQIENFAGVAEPPTIATRCAVFAKSDLIHRQQEGYGRSAMWSGLCRGLVGTILQTLCGGRTLSGPTLMIGGVSRNPEVQRWLHERLGEDFRRDPQAYLFPSIGAADVVAAELTEATDWTGLREIPPAKADDHQRAPLELRRSRYPDMTVLDEYVDERNVEVRRHVDLPGGALDVALGVDIGSTSTKAVVMDRDGVVLLDLYGRTSGDPIDATKRLLSTLGALQGEHTWNVVACATTGSGRKLVGQVMGADLVVNEISAHVRGARQVDPDVETIFEIGGQDAKFMDVRGGFLRDVNMNYVCAAGTGSFVEEQAIKLGFPVQAVGAATEGVAPPVTSDRCTVFMEQDVHRLLRQGYQREEVMAGVLYSVVQNYLNRVVGNRRRSPERITFQGATARNRGLVAAFENLLGVEVVVSPLCHQMGAYGAALLGVENLRDRGWPESAFRGLDLATREVTLARSTCELCANVCTITSAEIEGEDETPSWGYLCGRDPAEERMRRPDGLKPIRARAKAWRRQRVDRPSSDAPLVGIPRALGTWDLYPLWKAFLESLGFRVKLSPATNADIAAEGVKLSGSDYCFPMKLAHGHAVALLRDEAVDHVFMPFVIQEKVDSEVSTAAHLCPYNIAQTATVRAACAGAGIDASHIVAPPVDMEWTDGRMVRELHTVIGAPLGVSARQVRAAWQRASAALLDFRRECREIGATALAELERSGGHALVLLGRGYNLYDEGANVALPRKVAEQGWLVLPLDTLPLPADSLGPGLRNLFWWSGRRILEGARFARDHHQLHAMCFTNFSCGPDSFVLTYMEKIMGEEPYLVLELDEHGADGGYLTRIEAFVDVLGQDRPVAEVPAPIQPPSGPFTEVGDRTLWLAPMGLYGPPLIGAAFRGDGFDARPLPPETEEAFQRGKSLCRGTECLPAPATLGTLIHTVESSDEDPGKHAVFMPTACGPCRFGQYNLLQRLALDRIGMEDLFITSPGSDDTYAGVGTGLQLRLFQGVVLGDVLTKLLCRYRPYEVEPGRVLDVVDEGRADLERALEQRRDYLPVVRRIARRLRAIPMRDIPRKPLVGIVGEIYVRCNTFCNQDVIGAIEAGGGEAWLSPVSEWLLYTQAMEIRMAGINRSPVDWARARLRNAVLHRFERQIYDACGGLLDGLHEPPMEEVIGAGERFVPVSFQGETIITIGRAVRYLQDGAAMVVNCAPFTCMPGALTAGVLQQVQQELGAPVISLFYDGTGDVNRRVVLTLRNLGKDAHVARPGGLAYDAERSGEEYRVAAGSYLDAVAADRAATLPGRGHDPDRR
jgi:predicted CoA-substrate-specific enzyme activase